MTKTLLAGLCCAAISLASAAFAAAPAGAPTGSTGQCKDDSYWTGAEKRGACKGHKGVKSWWGAAAAAGGAATMAPAPLTPPATSKATNGNAVGNGLMPASGKPANAPAGSSGQCNDNSFWTGAEKKGACKGHKGVKTWWGAAAAMAAPMAAPTAAPTAPVVAKPIGTPNMGGAPAGQGMPNGKMATPPSTMSRPTMTNAPMTKPGQGAPIAGGSNMQVWVNTQTKIYHCPNTKWYGKTKAGSYMTEAQAIAAGAHADHGRACK